MFCMGILLCVLSPGPSLRQDPEEACRARRARREKRAGNPRGAGVARAGPAGANTARTGAGLRARARTGLGDCASKGCAERRRRRGASRPAHPAPAPRRPRPRAALGGIHQRGQSPLSTAAPGRPRRCRRTADEGSSWTGMALNSWRPGGRWWEEAPGKGRRWRAGRAATDRQRRERSARMGHDTRRPMIRA